MRADDDVRFWVESAPGVAGEEGEFVWGGYERGTTLAKRNGELEGDSGQKKGGKREKWFDRRKR